MFKLTDSPEFMAALQDAVVQATRQAGLLSPPSAPNPEQDWLDSKEAIAFLRTSRSGFQVFKKRHKERLVLSYAVGNTEPRYQRASLQAIMLAKSNHPELPLTGEPSPRPRNIIPRPRRGQS